MIDVSEENLPFILEKILLLRDTDREVTESKKSFISSEKKIIFYYREKKEEGEEVDLTQLRKNYTGTIRKKDYIIFIESKNKKVKGAFEIKLLRRIWKLTNKERLEKAFLSSPNENSTEANSLVLIFQSGTFVLSAVKILFPTDRFFATRIAESEKYANAFKRFKELVPFKIDQIIDLLGTEQLAYSIEEWEKNPLELDIPNVDTANISLAKTIIEELPDDELKLFIRTLREKISNLDSDDELQVETIERYKEALEYAKSLSKMKKSKKKEKG
ncbi:MAG: hypothetical protein K9W45_01520 [Candidatus Heimdallarchaeum aukensis]|uniref:Uncharacterized protein n=1 Tax=Candidatus Heimdallarchaeum aukensis TaxID=2876573 RepID=A0A9Y1FLB9_9ARCH|nr:MAG: hypothetical protein K9W45_01520 [Candidatus Heimdallarchaeum aukensis]